VRVNTGKTLQKILATAALLALSGHALGAEIPPIGREYAERAVATIKGQERISKYCKPCGQTGRELVNVIAAEHRYAPGGTQVVVNGEAVNIANVYIRRDKVWHNLAWLVGLDPGYSPRIMEWEE